MESWQEPFRDRKVVDLGQLETICWDFFLARFYTNENWKYSHWIDWSISEIRAWFFYDVFKFSRRRIFLLRRIVHSWLAPCASVSNFSLPINRQSKELWCLTSRNFGAEIMLFCQCHSRLSLAHSVIFKKFIQVFIWLNESPILFWWRRFRTGPCFGRLGHVGFYLVIAYLINRHVVVHGVSHWKFKVSLSSVFYEFVHVELFFFLTTARLKTKVFDNAVYSFA